MLSERVKTDVEVNFASPMSRTSEHSSSALVHPENGHSKSPQVAGWPSPATNYLTRPEFLKEVSKLAYYLFLYSCQNIIIYHITTYFFIF